MGNAEWNLEKINQIKWQLYRQISPLKQRVLQLYRNLQEGNMVLEDAAWKEAERIGQILYECAALFAMPDKMRESGRKLQEDLNEEEKSTVKQAALLEDMFVMAEQMDDYMRQRAKKCNVCRNNVFFTPIPAGYEAKRRYFGFLYWNADFQLESKDNYGCPVCGAYDRDRLMIAFLEDVRAEHGEKLRMLQIAPSASIERYALSREDIVYESTDLMMEGVTFQADLQHLDMVKDETYDIIVCSHVLEHVENDVQAMRELYRVLKPEGVCLVLVPLIVGKPDTEEQWGCPAEENWRRFGQGDHSRLYGKNDFIRRLQSAGFYVNELDKEWFGEEFYQSYGFDELSVMYVATKEIRLVERAEESLEQEIEKLRIENRLLRQALYNLNERLAAMWDRP